MATQVNKPVNNLSSNNLGSLGSSNNQPLSALNDKFTQALNTEISKESAANKSDTASQISGLNSRIQKSKNLYAANVAADSSGKKSSMLQSLLSMTGIQTNKPEMGVAAAGVPGEDGQISVLVNSENYVVILGVFIVLVLVILIYFLSKTFNVSRTLDKMAMYKRYQKITSVDMTKTEASQPLSSFHIASSYNSCHNGNQIISYTSELVLKSVIRSGARYLELNVFSDAYGPSGKPVVSNGFRRGEWKLMLNSLTFESAIRTISENAFKVSSEDDGAPNNTDPIFIGLNLSTGNNLACLNLMADILIDYFRDRLLDAKYAFQFTTEFAKTPLRELENKVIIFASPGFEGSRLEELINAIWVDYSFASQVKEGFTAMKKEKFAEAAGSNNKNKPKKTEKIENRMEKALITESAAAKGAKKSAVADNKKTGGPNNGQIESEKNRLTQVSSLAEELKNSGVDIPDVNELDEKAQQAAAEEPDREPLLDVPNPTSLGLDISGLGENQRATIMRIPSERFDEPGFDGAIVKAHSATGLVIVVPHTEGDYITRNYDPQRAFELGCQFVAMNYQLVDKHMDKYITKFEQRGILPI